MSTECVFLQILLLLGTHRGNGVAFFLSSYLIVPSFGAGVLTDEFFSMCALVCICKRIVCNSSDPGWLTF